MGVLIVGAGMAALRTAEALRANGYSGPIDVHGSEAHLPYNRPPLSKEGLKEGLSHERVAFKMRAAVADVQWHVESTITAADLTTKTVTTSGGDVHAYDALVCATGVRARTLPIPGPTAGRHVIRTLDDALSLRAELHAGAKVVVLGAGFIGCEVAATARALGCEVTNVAIDPLPMIRPLGEMLAGELQRRHEAHGVNFRLGTGVNRFLGEDRVQGMELSDGSILAADIVVEALGSAVNSEWLSGNDLDLNDGVLVDNALRPLTHSGHAIDGVAVVGDMARFPNPRFGEGAWRVEHWNIPTETGRRAGAVLAAFLSGDNYDTVVRETWTTLPSFWSDQFEMRIQSYGMPSLGDDIRLLEGELTGDCVVGYHRQGLLEGVVSIGALKQVNAYRDKVGRCSA